MIHKFYTGVGSRECPQDILREMNLIAETLAADSFILRSGAADGADAAFEKGCDKAGGGKEIYLPWPGFNDHESPKNRPGQDAYDLAREIHPRWESLSFGGKALHARNCYQVLGLDLNTPSKFLICWTKFGSAIGGTRTAIKLAERHKVPVINMFHPDWKVKLENELQRIRNCVTST